MSQHDEQPILVTTDITSLLRTMPPQRPGRSKQDYGTPMDFLDAVRGALKIADFYRDLAASQENAVCPCYFTEADDALEQDWFTPNANWNWLNPPFARLDRWTKKAYLEHLHAQTTMLVPGGVSTNWWAEWVHKKARVWFIRPRLTFLGTPINPKTGKQDPYPKDLALLQYGPRVCPGYGVWKWK